MHPDTLTLVADGFVGIAVCVLITWLRSKFQI